MGRQLSSYVQLHLLVALDPNSKLEARATVLVCISLYLKMVFPPTTVELLTEGKRSRHEANLALCASDQTGTAWDPTGTTPNMAPCHAMDSGRRPSKRQPGRRLDGMAQACFEFEAEGRHLR